MSFEQQANVKSLEIEAIKGNLEEVKRLVLICKVDISSCDYRVFKGVACEIIRDYLENFKNNDIKFKNLIKVMKFFVDDCGASLDILPKHCSAVLKFLLD